MADEGGFNTHAHTHTPDSGPKEVHHFCQVIELLKGQFTQNKKKTLNKYLELHLNTSMACWHNGTFGSQQECSRFQPAWSLHRFLSGVVPSSTAHRHAG